MYEFIIYSTNHKPLLQIFPIKMLWENFNIFKSSSLFPILEIEPSVFAQSYISSNFVFWDRESLSH